MASRCRWMPMTNHWQNNHRTTEGRHHLCSRNTANMCGTGIRHRSSNTSWKEKLHRGKQWMPAVSGCRQCIQQTQQKSQPRKDCVPPCTHAYTTATTHPPCYIWKIETTYWHSRAWHKGTLQQWQCMPYPHNRWYKHWAMKLQKVWYADDSSTVVSLAGVKKWWEYLKVKGHCPWNLHRPSS